MANRPIIFVYGNCQARKLVEAITLSSEVTGAAEVYYVPNFRSDADLAPGGDVATRAQYLAANADRALAIVYQSEFWDPASVTMLNALSATCRRVPMPALRITTLWPNYFIDFIARRARPPGPVYPYGDKVVAKAVLGGEEPAGAVAKYLASDVSKQLDLSRLHEINLGLLRKQEQDTGIDVAEWIAGAFANRPFFTSPNHPTNDVMRHVSDQILDRLGFSALDTAAAAAFVSTPPIGKDLHLPIHPSISQHLGLNYARPDQTFWYFGRNVTFSEWALGYAEVLRSMATPEELAA